MGPNARQWGRQVNTNKKDRFIDKESENQNAGNKKAGNQTRLMRIQEKNNNLGDTNQKAKGNKSKKKLRVRKEKTQDQGTDTENTE